MKTIGFPIPKKENESRRAIIPADVALLQHPDALTFERGYGEVLGYPDGDYLDAGASISTFDQLFECEVICNPKNPLPHEFDLFRDSQTLFGWIHAVQGKEMTDFLVRKQMTAIAWEDMFDKGLHVFWKNNEISGYAAIVHSFMLWGRIPNECKVAIIGRGNVARGALRALSAFGSDIFVYDRKSVGRLRTEIDHYDVVVNAVLWDVFRDDHLIYKEDLARMKPGSMIVDVSCDDHMGVETTHATTIEEPIYLIDGILHYAVDHTPALFYKSATESISKALMPFLDDLILERKNTILEEATIIRNGEIIDERVKKFQNRM
jgi:N5-(carboxyethyl)ornithine synthase